MNTRINALYCRVSTEMQKSKESIQTQKTLLENYAKENSLQFKIYADDGFSASSTSRPALQKLIQEIKENKIERVIVVKIDRITRRIKDLLDLVELFETHSVAFKSLTQPVDSSTSMGRAFINLLGTFAELERGMTSERVSEAMTIMSKKGKWLGGVVPFGYSAKNKELIPNPPEAEIIKKIYNKYLELESLRGVVHWLNSNGYKTRNKKYWATASIGRIIRNPNYIGRVTWGKRISSKTTGKMKIAPKENWLTSEGVHKAIIDDSTFKKVQDIISRQKREPRRKSSTYLLSGLCHCGLCGGKMNGYSQYKGDHKKYSSYKCHNCQSKGVSVCKGTSINKDVIENLVVEKILGLVDTQTFKVDIKKALNVFNEKVKSQINPLKTAKELLSKSLESIELKKRNLLEKLEDKVIENQTYKNRITELNEELEKNKGKIFGIEVELNDKQIENISFNTVYETVKNFKDNWASFDELSRKDLLYTLISKITVKGTDIHLDLFFLPSIFSSLQSRTDKG
ncbi:MAG: recombinase family protein [Candidatus Omnitrophota bacterium]